jgi:precorrin-3B methylase
MSGVEVAHVAGCDHGLYGAAEEFLEAREQVDFCGVGIEQDGGVEEDLVGFAEAEVELVLVEEFFVGLVMS